VADIRIWPLRFSATVTRVSLRKTTIARPVLKRATPMQPSPRPTDRVQNLANKGHQTSNLGVGGSNPSERAKKDIISQLFMAHMLLVILPALRAGNHLATRRKALGLFRPAHSMVVGSRERLSFHHQQACRCYAAGLAARMASFSLSVIWSARTGGRGGHLNFHWSRGLVC
jgi:hypothetical protein